MGLFLARSACSNFISLKSGSTYTYVLKREYRTKVAEGAIRILIFKNGSVKKSYFFLCSSYSMKYLQQANREKETDIQFDSMDCHLSFKWPLCDVLSLTGIHDYMVS